MTTVAGRMVAGQGGGVGRWGLAVLAGVLFLSAGCFVGTGSAHPRVLADLTESDVVGSWQEARGGAVITFTAEGLFEASDLPEEKLFDTEENYPPGFDPKRDRLPGSGDWHLNTGMGPADGPRFDVLLAVREMPGQPAGQAGGISLEAEREGDAVVLVFYLGDPDVNNRVVYEKCNGKCSMAPVRPVSR